MSDKIPTRQVLKMHSDLFLEMSRDRLRVLEQAERRRGASQDAARARVADIVGLTIGALHNLRAGRLKFVAAHVYEAIRQAAIRQITKEIEALTHELVIAEASGLDADDGAVVAAEIALANAVEALRKIRANKDVARGAN